MGGGFDLPTQRQQLTSWQDQAKDPDLWNNPEQAGQLLRKIEQLTQEINDYQLIEQRANDLIGLVKDEPELVNSQLVTDELLELAQLLDQLESYRFFDQPHDELSAILSIHAGTGGVDAQDWVAVLERMYLRYAAQQSWTTQIIDRQVGQEAGLKTTTLRLIGYRAYGYLQGEGGTHRLLRNSPFNAQNLRQTSFALVEILPELSSAQAPVINETDLQINVFRSSGPGGQSVNTTDSAVRIIHQPTGLTVTCQSERSQHQNKALALSILQSKLAQQQAEQLDQQRQSLKGSLTKADWGLQIRSYFLYGRQIIKDHRTEVSTNNVQEVLDGQLDVFLRPYWSWAWQDRQLKSVKK